MLVIGSDHWNREEINIKLASPSKDLSEKLQKGKYRLEKDFDVSYSSLFFLFFISFIV